MIPVVTAAEMRELDRVTIQELGVPSIALMECAGGAVAAAVLRLLRQLRLPPERARTVVVCGAGNNGGDGLVAARRLHGQGVAVRVLLAAESARLKGDARTSYDSATRLGVPMVDAASEAALAACAADLDRGDVIVDALFGTGLDRELTGLPAQLVERMNAAPGLRLAVDLPSGLSADTGLPLGVAVAAEETLTLAFPKVGLASWPGVERAGVLSVADIGIPRLLADQHGVRLHLLERSDVRGLLPARATGGHKGTYGHVLAIAGSHGKIGAALLCARGAARGGAGLVTIAAARGTVRSIEGKVAEVMCAELAPDEGALGAETHLDDLLVGKAAVCVGPGVPRTLGMQMLVLNLLESSSVPLVIDADALNLLAEAGEAGRRALKRAAGRTILTPHPGEAARLLGTDVPSVQADRVAAARKLAAVTSALVVLKGARSVLAHPDGSAFLNPTGTPAMASGGVGDVLGGLIGALLAQKLAPELALRLGVYAHGLAGEIAAAGRPVGVLAGDVADAIPTALARLARREGKRTIRVS